MRKFGILAGAAVAVSFVVAPPVASAVLAADSPVASSPAAEAAAPAPASDTIVILVSDTSFGPDMEDAEKAARYYCSVHGKLPLLISKDRPPEFRTEVFQEWSMLTYRCTVPAER